MKQKSWKKSAQQKYKNYKRTNKEAKRLRAQIKYNKDKV